MPGVVVPFAKQKESPDRALSVSLFLRGIDLAGGVGLVIEGSDRVLAASEGFLAEYCGRTSFDPPARLRAMGLDDRLDDRLRRALEEAAVGGSVEGLGGRAVVLEGEGRRPRIVAFVAAPEAHGDEERLPVDDPDGRPARVLLVEDDAMVRAQALRSLDGPGFKVHAVASALEALVAVESGARFDVVVTDVVMPEMSGPELAEQLAGRQPHLAVLFVSGYADGRLVDPGTPDAPRAFLAKPHTPSALRSTVARLWRDLRDSRA